MLDILKRVDNLSQRDVDVLKAFLSHDYKRAWLERKKYLVRKTGVNILAKLWIRSKRLRALKVLYLNKTRSRRAKMYKRDLPKGQIRLLQIKPGYAMSTIECAFTYLDLQESGNYVALSYTWGQAIPSIPIVVNGVVTMVTENLYMALLYLRKGGVTAVWVDALCINQNNLAERSTQVSQMAEVYQGARMVYVWLGESNKLSRRAFQELYQLTQHFDWDNKIRAAHFNTDLSDTKWGAISELLYRPWFRRVWVIQEILHARHALFVCGEDFLEATSFLTIINSMIEAGVLSEIMSFHSTRSELARGVKRNALQQLKFMVEARNASVDPLRMRDFRGNLLDYLSQTRWAEATDPRDKVYGILSLAKDASKLGWYEEVKQKRRNRRHRTDPHSWTWVPFMVDYTAPSTRVFINVTRAIIFMTRSIEILKFIESGTTRMTGLPSWVPNWGDSSPLPTLHIPFDAERQPQSSDRRVMWRPEKQYDYGTADTDRIRMKVSNNITENCSAVFSFRPNDTLTLKGIEFDKITALSTHTYPPAMDTSVEHHLEKLSVVRDYLVHLTQWIEECVQLLECDKPDSTTQEMWIVFKKMLYQEKVNHDDMSDLECFGDLLKFLSKAADALAIETRVHQLRDDEPLLGILQTAANVQFESISYLNRLPLGGIFFSGRRLAITANNYIGLAPEGAKVGDAVCVMYGSELPFILRRCGRRKFNFIGYGRFEGFDFDDAVVDKTYTPRGWEEFDRENTLVTWDTARRRVCTVLKKTTTFCLV